MALTRRFLTTLGIEEDKVEEIITAHSETVTALKKERDDAKTEAEGFKADADKYKAEAEKVPGLQKEVADLTKTAEENGENAWKVRYDAMKEERDNLKAEFDNFKNEASAKETAAKKDKAFRALLKEVGVSDKRIDAVVRVTKLDNIELDDEGNIKDVDKQKEAIKTDWADFIPTEKEVGAETATPPANTGGRKTKEEIDAIEDTSERQKAMLENHDLFGF